MKKLILKMTECSFFKTTDDTNYEYYNIDMKIENDHYGIAVPFSAENFPKMLSKNMNLQSVFIPKKETKVTTDDKGKNDLIAKNKKLFAELHSIAVVDVTGQTRFVDINDQALQQLAESQNLSKKITTKTDLRAANQKRTGTNGLLTPQLLSSALNSLITTPKSPRYNIQAVEDDGDDTEGSEADAVHDKNLMAGHGNSGEAGEDELDSLDSDGGDENDENNYEDVDDNSDLDELYEEEDDENDEFEDEIDEIEDLVEGVDLGGDEGNEDVNANFSAEPDY